MYDTNHKRSRPLDDAKHWACSCNANTNTKDDSTRISLDGTKKRTRFKDWAIVRHGDNCPFGVSASLVMTHNGARVWVDDKDADRISISLFPVSQHQPGPGRCKRRLTIPHLLGCLIPDHPSFGSIQLQNGCKTVLKKYFFWLFDSLYQPLVFLTKPWSQVSKGEVFVNVNSVSSWEKKEVIKSDSNLLKYQDI